MLLGDSSVVFFVYYLQTYERSMQKKRFYIIQFMVFQSQMLELYHEGKGDLFFKLWKEYLPPAVRDSDSVAQKLEFYLNIYFAIYPVKYNQPPVSIVSSNVHFLAYICFVCLPVLSLPWSAYH